MRFRAGPSRGVLSAGLLGAMAVPAGAQPRGNPRETGSGAIAPPASLTASSAVPTQIVLSWPPVEGAEGYRVTRASNAGEPEVTIYEGKAAAFAREPGMCRGTERCWYPNHNVRLKYLYSYRVHSIFPGPVYSAPSPVASTTSAPHLAPTNLTHAVVPSALKPGQLQVTVSWLPVTGAEGYYVVPTTRGSAATTVRTASVRFDPLLPKATYGLCVSTIYPLNVRDASVRSCITLVL